MREFKCLRCGDCCRWQGYVYITQEDVKRISGHLKMDESEFVNKYTEMAHRPRLNLRMKEGGACVFLDKNDCSLYPEQPKQCLTFPRAWRIKDLENFCSGEREISKRAAERP